MTKLTQQEIEKEREAFEEFIIKNRRTIAYFEINQHTKMYESGLIQMDFDVWLARAELAKGGE